MLIQSMRRFFELIIWGGKYRERVLLSLLGKYYDSKFKREWLLDSSPPHFDDNRRDAFDFMFSDQTVGPYPFYRGFFNSELINLGDRLLDIGCGDGFFAKHFFSPKCGNIDALDLDPVALHIARTNNSAKNIQYYQLNAIDDDFPCDQYDVIVWDGAIGHFSEVSTNIVLKKIHRSLTSHGVFAGSESLGTEECERDHLQFFYSLDDFQKIFQPYFKYIELRTVRYKINKRDDFFREEVFWRCSNDLTRLHECSWEKRYS